MVREFNIDDYGKVVELWKQTGLILRPGDNREGILLKLERDPNLFLIAEENHEIVGVVMGAWDGRRGWINHLAVRHNYQKRGIGRILISELERRLSLIGATKVNAQVYKWNKRSLEFFCALGYEVHEDLVMIGKPLRVNQRA
jgi:ribosomal protein S18 acetylase RimI-like enzyme